MQHSAHLIKKTTWRCAWQCAVASFQPMITPQNFFFVHGTLVVCRYICKGTELVLGSTLVLGPTLVQPFGLCTWVLADTRVNTRPGSPLSVGTVYILVSCYPKLNIKDYSSLVPTHGSPLPDSANTWGP